MSSVAVLRHHVLRFNITSFYSATKRVAGRLVQRRPGQGRVPAGAAPSGPVQHALEGRQPDAHHEAKGAAHQAEEQPGMDGQILLRLQMT